MKFLCPSCKAKYQIADEKILGRTLKMTCRRCNTAITVRGDLPGAGDAEAVAELDPGAAAKPAAASPAGPTPSARPHAQPGATAAALAAGGGSALGADFRKQGLAPVEAKTATIEQWHVAINEVPVGPMRREEVSRKMATGAVTAESLAWREGFDDWRPVRDIPELAALLRKPEAAAPPRGLPAPRGGAAARPAPMAAPAAGRPAPRAAVPASAGALGASAKGASAAPSARSNVVPIGGRLGGAAPALEEDEQSADEPTQVASVRDLGLLAAEQAQAQKDGRGTAKPAVPPAEATKPAAPPSADTGAGGPEAASSTSPGKASASVGLAATAPAEDASAGNPYTAAASRAEAAKPTPIQAAVEPAAAPPAAGGDDGLPPLLEAPPPAFVTPTAPPPPAAPLSEPPAPSIPPRRAAERRGIPVGGWIAIAGSVAFGGVFAVIAAQRLLPPPPAAPAPAAAAATLAPPAPPTPPPTPPPVTEPAVPAEAAPPVPPTEAAEPAAAEPAAEPAAGRGGSRPRGGAAAPASTGTATTGGTRPLSPDFARLSEDSAALPAISGGAASRRLGGEPSGSGARRELSADEIREVVSRERTGLTRCWETAIRGMRETPTVRLDVSVTIGTSGAVTNAAARGPTVGSLTECIERSVRRWHFPPSGGTTETSFPVVFSGSS